jgi:hypothetical protein
MIEILNELDKYYLYVVNNKKAILLSSSDSKSELRNITLKKLGNKIDKYNGLYLYRIKLMKVPKKDLLNDIQSKIKMIGGPIVAYIEHIQINVNNNQTKLVSIDTEIANNKIYFSSVYLEKYETIKLDTLTDIVWKFAHNKFNDGLFAINTINK